MEIYKKIWSPSIWVPPGYEWKDLKTDKIDDLWTYPFLIASAFITFKYLFLTPFVFYPIGKFLKLKSNEYKTPPANKRLEAMHTRYRSKPPYDLIKEVSKDINWTERQIQRWLRQRTLSNQSSTLDKFDDCAWQLLYYSTYCIFGILVHYDKPWFYDISHCWKNFPHHELDNDVWLYYMVALGFYWSQTVTHFFQPQRSDSLQMLCHHLVTIMLICLSWTCNFVRIGTLVLVIHECADIPLLIAKIFGYCGKQKMMDLWFIVFLLLWIVTRLGFYPLKILKSTLFEAHVQEDLFYPVYYIFNGLLLAIFLMHILWTYNIIQVIVRKFSTNKISDVRSSASELSSSDDETYPPVSQEDKKKLS